MKTRITALSAVALLALTACDGNDSDSAEVATEATEATTEAQEPETATAESEPVAEPDAEPELDPELEEEVSELEESFNEMVDEDVEYCAQDIAEGQTVLSCRSSVLPQGAFFVYFEEQEGYPIPEEHKPDNLTDECEEMGAEWYMLVEHNPEDDAGQSDAMLDQLASECGEELGRW